MANTTTQLRKTPIRAQESSEGRVILKRTDSTNELIEVLRDTVTLKACLKESFTQNLLSDKVRLKPGEIRLGNGAMHA